MEEITAIFNINDNDGFNAQYSIDDEDNFDVTLKVYANPDKLSELQDDIGVAKNVDLTELQTQVNNFQQAENTEMTNIVTIIQDCANNLIDLTEIDI